MRDYRWRQDCPESRTYALVFARDLRLPCVAQFEPKTEMWLGYFGFTRVIALPWRDCEWLPLPDHERLHVDAARV